MPRENDDWMNPPTSIGWSNADYEKERREKPFLICRCRRITCFGSPGYIDQWDVWSRYKTREERDTGLRKLRSAHSWTLRPEREDMLGHRREDTDEDMILAQAEMIKAARAAKA